MPTNTTALSLERAAKGRKVLLLLGAGAEENCWAPVRTAVAGMGYGEGARTDNETCTLAMANLIFQLRWLKQIEGSREPLLLYGSRLNHLQKKYPTLAMPLDDLARLEGQQTKNLLDSRLSAYRNLKVLISTELATASSIRVQPELGSVIERLRGASEIRVVTTNWDHAADDFIRETGLEALAGPVGHLHGSIGDPVSLYLPSEMTLEIFRPAAPVLMESNSQMMVWIETADVFVVYGQSLSPLDAELSLLFSEGVAERDRAAPICGYVVDSEPERVAKRLSFLLQSHAGSVVAAKPVEFL